MPDDQNTADLLQQISELKRRLEETQSALLTISGTPTGDQLTQPNVEFSYRVVLEQMAEGAVTLNNQGKIVFSNTQFATLTESSMEKVLSSDFIDFIAPESRPLYEELLKKRTGRQEVTLLGKFKKKIPCIVATNRLNMGGVASISIVITDLTEHRKNESLIAKGQLVQNIVEHSTEGIIICNARGEIINTSQTAAKLAGGNVNGHKFESAFPMLQFGETPISLKAIEAGTIPNKAELTFNSLDGTHKNFLISYSKLSEGREILGWIITLSDITDRKRAEETLQNTLNRFYTVLSDMPMGIMLVSEDGVTEFANQTFCDMFKLKECPDELKNIIAGEHLSKIKHAYRNPEEAVARVTAIIRRGEAVKDEEVPMQDGRTLLRDFVPVRVGQRQFGRLWINRDITERKKAEEALQASEGQFRVLTENLRSGVALIDEAGKFSIVNPSFLRMFGLAKDTDILSVNSQEWDAWKVYEEDGLTLLHVDDHPVRRAALTGKPVKDKLVGVRVPDGKDIVWMLVNAEPVLKPNGNTRYLIVTYHDITDRKKAEEALKESETRFFKAFHDSPVPQTIARLPDGRWVEVNDSFLKLMEYTREEVIGHTSAELNIIDPQERARVLKSFLEKGIQQNMEMRVQTKTGKSLTVLSSNEKISLNGQPYSISTQIDITERKNAEEALKASDAQNQKLIEELTLHHVELETQAEDLRDAQRAAQESRNKFMELFENAPVGYLALEKSGDIAEANLTVAGLLGVDRNKLIHTPLSRFIAPESQDAFYFHIKQAFKTRVMQRCEIVMVRGDKSTFCALMESIADHSEGHIRMSVTEITERRQAAESLRASEDKNRAFFENNLDAVILTSPDGSVQDVNDAACRMFGLTRQEFMARGRDGLVELNDPRLKTATEERAKTGKFKGELSLRRKDGTIFQGEVSSSFFTDSSGQTRTALIIRDVTGTK